MNIIIVENNSLFLYENIEKISAFIPHLSTGNSPTNYSINCLGFLDCQVC